MRNRQNYVFQRRSTGIFLLLQGVAQVTQAIAKGHVLVAVHARHPFSRVPARRWFDYARLFWIAMLEWRADGATFFQKNTGVHDWGWHWSRVCETSRNVCPGEHTDLPVGLARHPRWRVFPSRT